MDEKKVAEALLASLPPKPKVVELSPKKDAKKGAKKEVKKSKSPAKKDGKKDTKKAVAPPP